MKTIQTPHSDGKVGRSGKSNCYPNIIRHIFIKGFNLEEQNIGLYFRI